MVVRLKMNSVMDKATYDQHQMAKAAEMEAEKNRLMALESKAIADYIKTHGITEAPTETGLYILKQEEGLGNVAQWGDEVTVHFTIKNIKDEQLESSYDYGELFPAIEEAVMTMSKGSKVTLVTPSALAFGEADLGEILPPYSPLVIELELVEIK